jgi:hypothetical protein
MLRDFDLLVAARQGEYVPPPEFEWAIERLEILENWDAVSSSEVRCRIAQGRPWDQLVPAHIREEVRRVYHTR